MRFWPAYRRSVCPPQRRLTLPSRGCPKGCAFCAPLMSNVRPKEHEHKVSTELRRANLAAKQISSKNSCALSTAGPQVTLSAGRPSFGGRRTTCALERKSYSLSFRLGAAGEAKHSESSLRSPAVRHARESPLFGSQPAVAVVYSLLSVHVLSNTARFQESGSAKIVVASTRA